MKLVGGMEMIAGDPGSHDVEIELRELFVVTTHMAGVVLHHA